MESLHQQPLVEKQAFLHARFGLGEDALQPYKKNIDQWLWLTF
jgi:hypothetical protein